MVSTMRFVGIPVDGLLDFASERRSNSDAATAAHDLLEALKPVGEGFEVPWKLKESLMVLSPWIPADLEMRLLNPGMSVPTNHLEASILSLAREGGACLEPLSANDLHRMQAGILAAIEADDWGRQSPHPWDTLAEAQVHPTWFYAFSAPVVMSSITPAA